MRNDGAEPLPRALYAVMAVTSLSTFATLATLYEILFVRHPFA